MEQINQYNSLETHHEFEESPDNAKLESLKRFICYSKSKKSEKKFIEKNIFETIIYNAFKAIIKMMNEYFPKLPGLSSLKNFKQIPMIFIRNSKLKFNYEMLQMTLEQFVLRDYGSKINKKFQHNLNNILIIKQEHSNNDFLNLKLKDVFNLYFKSNYFIETCEKIKINEHEFYYKRYLELSRKFVEQ